MLKALGYDVSYKAAPVDGFLPEFYSKEQ